MWLPKHNTPHKYLHSVLCGRTMRNKFPYNSSHHLVLIKTRMSSSIRSKKSEEAERGVTKTIVNIMVAFLICWTPYAMVALTAVSHPGIQVSKSMPQSINIAHVFINPDC